MKDNTAQDLILILPHVINSKHQSHCQIDAALSNTPALDHASSHNNRILSLLMTSLIFQSCQISGLQDVLLTAVPVSEHQWACQLLAPPSPAHTRATVPRAAVI